MVEQRYEYELETDDTEEDSAILICQEAATASDNEQTLDFNSPEQLLTVSTPPKDRFSFIYFIFVFVGVGILIPWNSFILSIDYFRFLYPTRHVENVIPYTDLFFTLLAVVVSITIVNILPAHWRISFGYVIFLFVLLFLPLLDIGIHNCTVSTDVGFILTVLSVIIISIGSGVQESSYYGMSGTLPPRFTQALLLGESISGVIVSVLRVITKVSTSSLRNGAIAFFTIGIVYVLMCFVCSVIIYRNRFVKYYMKQAKDSNSVEVNNESDSTMNESQEMKSFSIQSQSPTPNWFDKVNVVIFNIKGKIVICYQILKCIWKVGLSTFLMMVVTLLMYPGLSSDIQYCSINDWPPVISAVVFNVFDAISRIIALLPFRWNPNVLILISCSRVILVPLLVLCVSPSPANPIIPGSLWFGLIIIAILGATNGYFATIGMMQGPLLVQPHLREITGNIMVFFLLGGLTTGSILATALTPLTELQSAPSCTNITAEFLCSLKHNISVYS